MRTINNHMRLGSLKSIPQFIDHVSSYLIDSTAQLVGHLEPQVHLPIHTKYGSESGNETMKNFGMAWAIYY